jgi:hypothetical protein
MQVIYSMALEVLTCIGDLLTHQFHQHIIQEAGWWRIDGNTKSQARSRYIDAFNNRKGFSVCSCCSAAGNVSY